MFIRVHDISAISRWLNYRVDSAGLVANVVIDKANGYFTFTTDSYIFFTLKMASNVCTMRMPIENESMITYKSKKSYSFFVKSSVTSYVM